MYKKNDVSQVNELNKKEYTYGKMHSDILFSRWLVFWQMQFKKDQESILFLVSKSNWKNLQK